MKERARNAFETVVQLVDLVLVSFDEVARVDVHPKTGNRNTPELISQIMCAEVIVVCWEEDDGGTKRLFGDEGEEGMLNSGVSTVKVRYACWR